MEEDCGGEMKLGQTFWVVASSDGVFRTPGTPLRTSEEDAWRCFWMNERVDYDRAKSLGYRAIRVRIVEASDETDV
jgi:hypothetical protein